MDKVASTLIMSLCVLLTGYLGLRTLGSLQQGYPWGDMDWDEDGSTTFTEFLAARDIGQREVQHNGQACIEYFAYKDGVPVRTVCPGQKGRGTGTVRPASDRQA